MKSKSIVYLLAFSVLGIWGVILFRVYFSIGNKDDKSPLVAKTLPVRKADVPKMYPDTFKLLMNYSDPFTGSAAVATDTANKENKKLPPSEPQVQSETNPVQKMKYLGYVRDGHGRNVVAIISLNGKEKMMKKGDTLGGGTLTAIQRNLVIMRYKAKSVLIKVE